MPQSGVKPEFYKDDPDKYTDKVLTRLLVTDNSFLGFEGNYLATIPDAKYKITGYNFIKTIEEEEV